MAHQRRGYWYRNERIGGRVVSQYLGKSPAATQIAELDALDQLQRSQERAARQAERTRFARLTRAPPELEVYRGSVRATVRRVLRSLGFHQHCRRWRLHHMTNTDLESPIELAKMLYRKRPPTPEDIARFRALLDQHTQLAAVFGDQAAMARRAMLPSGDTQPIIRAAIDARCRSLAADLGGEGATELERLLIDEVVLTWLDKHRIDMHYGQQVESGSITLDALEQWEKVLSSKQARYLRAIETLARVRRLLKLPTVQVNVALEGGQQVNMQG